MLSESRISSVSRGYIVPPSGSNGQSDANTIFSNGKNSSPHLVAGLPPNTAGSAEETWLKKASGRFFRLFRSEKQSLSLVRGARTFQTRPMRPPRLGTMTPEQGGVRFGFG